MVFIAPRVGGGTDDATVWTGGSAIHKRTHPVSVMARRPIAFKAQSQIEEKAKKGLPEGRKLSLDEGKTKITLTSWIAALREYCEERGLDSVFRIRLDSGEVYLLEEWGQTTLEGLTLWISDLKRGVPKYPITRSTDGTIERLAVCQYDISNLQWSGKAVLNSIDMDLWSEIEKELSYNATGPEDFLAVIERIQQTTSSSVRKLVEELQKMNILREPAQNV
jgi:hypothetical protein